MQNKIHKRKTFEIVPTKQMLAIFLMKQVQAGNISEYLMNKIIQNAY